jgi:hypothetical protein
MELFLCEIIIIISSSSSGIIIGKILFVYVITLIL